MQSTSPVDGAKRHYPAIDLGGRRGTPAVTHFVSELRHGVVVRQHFSFCRAVAELVSVKSDVVSIANRSVIGRPRLHLVRSDVNRLHVAPLESTLAAVALEIVLAFTYARDIATSRTVAGRARLLVVDAEVGIIGKKIKPVPSARITVQARSSGRGKAR